MPVRPRSRRLLTTTAALLATLSCVDRPEPRPQFDEDACTNFVVLQKMGLGWERLNHRVSTWSVALDHDGCEATRAEVTHIGGDFSTGDLLADTPLLELAWQPVSANPARVGVARVSIETVLEATDGLSVQRSFSRSDLNLRGYPTVVAVLDGVHFEAGIEQGESYPDDYNPAHGYTVRGFGAGARVSDLTAEQVQVTADFQLDIANSPDRPNHNRALEHAQIGARIDVLLIGIGTAPLHQAEVTYSMSYPDPVPTEDQQIDPPPADKTDITIAGAPGEPAGFWGLSRFDFQYDFDGSCERTNPDCAFFAGDTCEDDGYCAIGREEPGEYLRAISVGVDLLDYDADSGAAQFRLLGYTSNASNFLANYALAYDFTGAIVWVQASGAADRHEISEIFETGSITVPLDPAD